MVEKITVGRKLQTCSENHKHYHREEREMTPIGGWGGYWEEERQSFEGLDKGLIGPSLPEQDWKFHSP